MRLPGMTRFFSLVVVCFWGRVVALPPFHQRSIKIYILQILSILSSAFYHPFHLSTFKDPVIRVLSLFSNTSPIHHVTTSTRQHDVPSPCPPYSGQPVGIFLKICRESEK
jgi:hypothetical protein